MLKKLKHYAAHYFFGLCTSCWNAGINALKINSGLATAAAVAPTVVTHIDLRAMLGVFIAAAVWEAVDYFDEHRLPTNLADLDKCPAPAAAVAVVTQVSAQ